MDGSRALPGPTAYWFDDFYVGQSFALPARAMTEGMMSGFAEVCGDAGSEPPRRADPFLVLAQTALGAARFAELAQPALIGLVEQSSRFLREVWAGDELWPNLWVDQITPEGQTGLIGLRCTLHNQRRELVLDGFQQWRLRRR